jgi:hypothetical protein
MQVGWCRDEEFPFVLQAPDEIDSGAVVEAATFVIPVLAASLSMTVGLPIAVKRAVNSALVTTCSGK